MRRVVLHGWRIEPSAGRMADHRQNAGEETMRALGRTVLMAATLMSVAGMAGAADIRVLGVGAVQHAVRALAAQFNKETGQQVVLTIGSPAVVMQKIKAG